MHTDPQFARHLEALLEFHLEAGVDCLVGDAPLDWVQRSVELAAAQRQARDAGPAGPARSAPQSNTHMAPGNQPNAPQAGSVNGQMDPAAAGQGGGRSFPTRPVPPAPQSATILPGPGAAPAVPTAETIRSASDLARSCATLDDLRERLAAFDGCNLRLTAKSLVFGEGNPEARVMLVGEAPGRDEDQIGRPFVGRSGALLDRMLAAIGQERGSVYLANVVPWRPPGDRTPTPQEVELCKPFVLRQIELVRPQVLIFLGVATAKTLIGTTESIRRLRGRWIPWTHEGREMQCLATYHPDFLLRNPNEKRSAWSDFLALRQVLSPPQQTL